MLSTGTKGSTRRSWVPPEEGFHKINVDGGVDSAVYKGAAAAICRTHDGVYAGSSSMLFKGILDPTCLEALACREALCLAADLMLQNVVISCDSKGMVEDIKDGTAGRHEMIIKEIWERMNSFNSCSFIFESRSTNRDAHNLCKFATSLDPGRHVWFLYPHDTGCVPVNVVLRE